MDGSCISEELFDAVDEELIHRQGHPKRVVSDGREHVYDCPVCEKPGKLTVNPEKGVFNCWSCGAEEGTRGGLEKLARLVDLDPEEIIDKLLSNEEMLARLSEERPVRQVIDFESVLQADETVIAYPPGSQALDATAYGYLRGRGITDAEIGYYRLFIGMANGAKRIMIPDFNARGGLRYWQGRLYLPQHAHRNDKYAAPDRSLVPRQSKFFNWHRALAYNFPYLILCEGPLDAIAAGPMAIAQWGKDWTQEQLALLARCRRVVLVAYDGDAWTQSRAMAATLESFRLDARPVPIPYGQDPLSLGKTHFYEILKSTLGCQQNDLTLLEAAVRCIE